MTVLRQLPRGGRQSVLILYPFAQYYQKGTKSMKATVKKSLRLWIPILLVSLLLALFSASVFAEEADPGDTWWSLDQETGILSIYEDIPQYCNWMGIYPPWNEWGSVISEIRISEGVEVIGQYAFAECDHLVRVVLPSTLTTIDDYAFNGCLELQTITFPERLTTIGEGAFGDCVKLQSVTFPMNLKSVEISGFIGCTNLKAFRVDERNPYYASDEAGILYNKDMTVLICCPEAMTGTLTIPRGVTTLGECSMGYSNLIEVRLPDSVKTVEGSAFAGCTLLKVVDIAKADLNDPSGVFSGCNSLEKIIVSKDNPFFTCDEQGALYDKSMTTLYMCLPSFKGKFVVPQGVKSIFACAFSDCTGLKDVVIPIGVEGIEGSVFAGCTALESVSLPDGLAYISDSGFKGCTALKTIRIPGSVKVIEPYAFAHCTSLTSVTLEEGITELWGYVFAGCTALEAVTIPTSVTVLGDEAFTDCITLKTVVLSAKLDELPYRVFAGCYGLKNITLPKDLRSIGDGAFALCYSLESIQLPEELRSLGEDAFFSCGMLETVILPYGLERIENGAFSYCRALRSLYIPDSVKDLGWSILYGCESLTSVVLPSCVTDLDIFGIGDCESLKAIYLRGPAPVQEYMYLPDGVTLYYIEGQEGWTTPLWEGYNTKTWSGYWATDVKESDYFYEPVQWALEEGITTGVGKDLFRPENTCTRAQVVTFLWRAKGCPEPTTTENPFKDVSPKDYYYKAVLWAAEQGITTGVTKDRFAPEKGCTRAQIVTFLWRAEGEPQTSNVQNPFKDIEEDTYYSHAVLWAVEQGITTGKTKDKFAPEDLCTRGQIVTFLWRGRDPVPNPYAPYYSILQDVQEKAGAEPINGRGLLYDLDGNGTEELILTYLSDGDHCAVYTVEEGKAVSMLEDHVYVVMEEGDQCELGLAEIDGQQYLYTYAESYKMEENDVYGDMMHYTTRWKLYLPSEEGMALAIEVDREEYCALNHSRAYWDIVEELSSLRINGEEKPLEDYWDWYGTVDLIGSLNRESGCGYSIEDLLTVCKP